MMKYLLDDSSIGEYLYQRRAITHAVNSCFDMTRIIKGKYSAIYSRHALEIIRRMAENDSGSKFWRQMEVSGHVLGTFTVDTYAEEQRAPQSNRQVLSLHY